MFKLSFPEQGGPLFQGHRSYVVRPITVGGTAFPSVGLGTSSLRGWTCRRVVHAALELGYRHIDTAQAYANESDVGRAIAASGVPRTELFVSTKLEQARLSACQVGPALNASLKRLGMDYVDLLMIHWPSDQVPLRETLEAFVGLQIEGKVRHIGVCNFTLRHLREAVEENGATLFCNQVEYHPFLSQEAILPFMRQHGIALVAYSPLARGLAPRNPELQRIGAKYGKSAAQVALAWLVGQEGVGAIPKASSRANCRSNIDIFDFRLSPDDLAAIDRLRKDHRIVNPSWAPNWDSNDKMLTPTPRE